MTLVSGCRAQVLNACGRSLGRFLCYDLSCIQCRQAVQERQQQLSAARRNPQTTRWWNSPSSSARRRSLGHSMQRTFLLQHRGKPYKGPETLRPLTPATAHPGLELHSQANKLSGPAPSTPERDIGHQAGSPTTLDSCLADRGGGCPLGVVDLCPTLRLQLEDFRKRLQAHVWRKCKQIRLGTLPALVQQSHRTVPSVLLHPSSAPVYCWSPEALLPPHLQGKELHPNWGLPGKSPGSATREHHAELDGHRHCAPQPHSGEPKVEEGPHLPWHQTASILIPSQPSPKSTGGRTVDRAGREAAAGHQDSSWTQRVLKEEGLGSRLTGKVPGKDPPTAGWHREPTELSSSPPDAVPMESLDNHSRMRVLHQASKAITFLIHFSLRPALLKQAVYRILGLHRLSRAL